MDIVLFGQVSDNYERFLDLFRDFARIRDRYPEMNLICMSDIVFSEEDRKKYIEDTYHVYDFFSFLRMYDIKDRVLFKDSIESYDNIFVNLHINPESDDSLIEDILSHTPKYMLVHETDNARETFGDRVRYFHITDKNYSTFVLEVNLLLNKKE